MTADSIALIIAGVFGGLVGVTIGFLASGLFLKRIRNRAIKESWRCATNFYARKEAERS